MGRFSAKALGELGYEVVLFDYWPTWQDKLQQTWLGRFRDETYHTTNRRFREVVIREKPDLVLAIYGFHLSVESLQWLKQRDIPSVCWWLNDPFQWERSMQKAPYFDFVFTNAWGSVADYQQRGVNAYWLPTACDRHVHHPGNVRSEWLCDVGFAGDWSPLREQWLTHMAKDYDVKVFGPWRKKLAKDSPLHACLVDGFFSPEVMVDMFASSKIVLNIHTWYGKWSHGTNPRLFEAAGCGAAQAVDWRDELPQLFDCEKELLTYHDLDDLHSKLAPFLCDTTKREQAGILAQQRAYTEHTYQQRMQFLLSTVNAG